MSQAQTATDAKTATLYRMVMEDHICPSGRNAKALLESRGFVVEDNWLTTRPEVDAFKQEHGVATTPQIFIADERIGGYDDLRQHLGDTAQTQTQAHARDGDGTTYQPVIAIFSVAALMALAFSWAAFGTIWTGQSLEWFVAIAMCSLGVQKLQDIERFSTMFLRYDLLARRYPRYGMIYPYAETLVGVAMITGAMAWFAAPVALFIGSIGAVSVYKAVYMENRALKCACVGGDSRVPLGFVSLLENVTMVAVALWMFLR